MGMNCEQFEQLVSAWLDTPHDAALREAIAAAIAEEPGYAAVRDAWIRCEELVKVHAPQVAGVRFERLAAHVHAAVADAPPADGLDTLLGNLPDVSDRVDWDRLHQRVTTAVRQSHRVSRRWTPWRVATGFGALAAAAAVVFAVIQLTPSPAARQMHPVAQLGVQVAIALPPVLPASTGEVTVRVAVADTEVPPPTRIFMIDPVVSAAQTQESNDYF